MKYYVVNDMKSNTREAFVITENEWTEVSSNYSGYYIEKIFDSANDGAEGIKKIEELEEEFKKYIE